MVEIVDFSKRRNDERYAECMRIIDEVKEWVEAGDVADIQVSVVKKDGSTGHIWTETEHIQLVIAACAISLNRAIDRCQHVESSK